MKTQSFELVQSYLGIGKDVEQLALRCFLNAGVGIHTDNLASFLDTVVIAEAIPFNTPLDRDVRKYVKLAGKRLFRDTLPHVSALLRATWDDVIDTVQQSHVDEKASVAVVFLVYKKKVPIPVEEGDPVMFNQFCWYVFNIRSTALGGLPT